ncbi:hypothetical protein PZA11_003378 [Diplocarpon coronariae]
MALPIRDIPGYYFDNEKNKYFKIQPQGPASSAYSERDVKRRKLRDENEVAIVKEKQRQAGRIQRSKILEDPLFGGVLTREYGYAGFDPAVIVAGGLMRCGTLCTKYHGTTDIIELMRPQQSIPLFTLKKFGSSQGILAAEKKEYNTTWLTPKPSEDPTQSDDLFALAFITSTPSVLLSGGRKGLLKITDLRVPVFGLDADTIIHPSTITHVQVLDTHRIIVNGLNSSLCQYDLRFRKNDTTRSIIKKKATAQRNITPTRSILRYKDFQNDATVQIGFDVDLDSGIVAAGQEFDEFHTSVQLFSLHGGHKLDSPNVSEYLPESEVGRVVKCLRFAQDSDAGIKSLYVGRGLDIQRYAWGEDTNESERKVVLDYEN